MHVSTFSEVVAIPSGMATLEADLSVPERARGLVIFAHGSGSSRFSTRNHRVADSLNGCGFATLLLDLLTAREGSLDFYTSQYRFDIGRLGSRVADAAEWAAKIPRLSHLPIALFGASTGAAAALVAAAERPALIRAVVSRGGRPDLAGSALPRVKAPTLFIAGGNDHPVLELNRHGMHQMRVPATLHVVAGATHLFEEPGALQEVERVAGDWLTRNLR
jgi:pimeloyl-ACP methyl ester carboxylesterase